MDGARHFRLARFQKKISNLRTYIFNPAFDSSSPSLRESSINAARQRGQWMNANMVESI